MRRISYLHEEVNRTEPFPSKRLPCRRPKLTSSMLLMMFDGVGSLHFRSSDSTHRRIASKALEEKTTTLRGASVLFCRRFYTRPTSFLALLGTTKSWVYKTFLGNIIKQVAWIKSSFVQLGFNEADTLESSSILLYWCYLLKWEQFLADFVYSLIHIKSSYSILYQTEMEGKGAR